VSTRRSVLVTGAGGQVGREATSRFEAAGWDVVACDRTRLDVADRDAVLAAVTTVRPHAVVNLAAWNAVDAAESDPEGALRINALAVRHLAEASRRVGARLCHVSTDYVFDGTKDGPYTEWDRTNPLSAYGRSKEAGEREAGPEALVVRTSWVCGAQGSNAVKTVLKLAAEPDRTLAFVTDQVGCPTMAADLAATLVTLVGQGHAGMFHVTNGGPVSWYEFVQAILEAGGHSPDRVRPITTAEMDPPRPAPRPANSVLGDLALRGSGLAPLRHHREALAELVAEIRAQGEIPVGPGNR
jgi:dTDP-4-dehydrorhamnose reductase